MLCFNIYTGSYLHISSSFPSSKHLLKCSHLNVSSTDMHSFICMHGIFHLISLHLLNQLVPQQGREMHHCCTVSVETTEDARLLQCIFNPLRYCESIILSFLQLVTSSHANTTALLLFLSSVAPTIPSLCRPLHRPSSFSFQPSLRPFPT